MKFYYVEYSIIGVKGGPDKRTRLVIADNMGQVESWLDAVDGMTLDMVKPLTREQARKIHAQLVIL